ncbi:MAG: hypothetical protein ACI4PH_03640 [Faecousia sp.]
MSGKIDWLESFKQWFTPKVGTDRWLKVASKEAIMTYRDELWHKLMDPNEDFDLRWRIRDKLLPYINKILRDRDK